MTLGVVILDGAPPVEPLVLALAREGTVPAAIVPALDSSDGPDQDVVLVWAPAGVPEDLVDALVAWRRRATRPVGMIGCSPHGDSTDSERALAAGFDDWVAGRSSVRELAARVRAVHRRLTRPAGDAAQVRFGRIVLDPARHELVIGGRHIPLTAMELALLTTLASARGATLTRAQLLDRVWGDDELDVGLRAVDNLVLRLRRKLEGAEDVVVTVRGVGFRLAD